MVSASMTLGGEVEFYNRDNNAVQLENVETDRKDGAVCV